MQLPFVQRSSRSFWAREGKGDHKTQGPMAKRYDHCTFEGTRKSNLEDRRTLKLGIDFRRETLPMKLRMSWSFIFLLLIQPASSFGGDRCRILPTPHFCQQLNDKIILSSGKIEVNYVVPSRM